MDWYPLFVITGSEDVVKQYLHYHFDSSECSAIIPKSRLTERTKGKFYEVLKRFFQVIY